MQKQNLDLDRSGTIVLTVPYPCEVGGTTMRQLAEFGGTNKELVVLIPLRPGMDDGASPPNISGWLAKLLREKYLVPGRSRTRPSVY